MRSIEVTPTTVKAHKAVADFPNVSDEQYDALRASVAQYGVLEPIVVIALSAEDRKRYGPGSEWAVIDGRTRLRAALELNLPSVPARVVADDIDPVTYAIESAVAGRNLTKSGIVLLLFLKHPALAAERAERVGGRPKKELDVTTSSFRQVAQRYGVPRDYFVRLGAIQDASTDAEWGAVQHSILAGEAHIPTLYAGLGGRLATKGRRRHAPRYDFLARNASTTLVNVFKHWSEFEFSHERLEEKTAANIRELFAVAPDPVRQVQADVIVESWPEHERKALARRLKTAQ